MGVRYREGGRNVSDNAAEIQRRFVRQAQVRIEPEMARYVLRRAARSGASNPTGSDSLAVMGADARTGAPLRRIVNVREILNS